MANETRREVLRLNQVEAVQFDDLITSLHTKCKPLSVSIAVDSQSREILALQVSDMPARHPLRAISIRKYGLREDERPMGLRRLFHALTAAVSPRAKFRSDSDPEYLRHVLWHFPHAHYDRVKARTARTAGFGELKRIGFDPLFSLNHTCAMLRANLNRLARKTWCTTKSKIGLLSHLELYADYHNSQLIPRTTL